MAINSINSSSTMDIQSIVSALTKSQDIKISTVQSTEKKYQTKISDLGLAKSKIQSFQDSVTKVALSQVNNLSQADLKSSLQGFVDTYNSMKTQLSTSAQNQLKTLTSKIRQELDPSQYVDLGISFDKFGVASFNGAKFDTNYTADSTKINGLAGSVFTNLRTKQTTQSVLDPASGTIALQQRTYQSKMTQLQREEDNLVRQKDLMTENLTKQYASLQNILNGFNSQGSSISNFLGKA